MYQRALFSLTILFFMMGLITCLNDILVPYLKSHFNLEYVQAALIQFCFFGAYGLGSIPSSLLLEKVGYQRGMIYGFILASLGCMLFYPAVILNVYELFLAALFVLAIGIVMLQVAANPFVTLLGPPEDASSRLTMMQAFNSFGTFVAPFFGSYFILAQATNGEEPVALKLPYIILAGALLLVATLISRIGLPKVDIDDDKTGGTWKEALRSPSLVAGIIGIFAYVGAEVSIGSFLVNYVVERSRMPETQAANLVALYWGSAMIGRFLGFFTLKEFLPGKVLSFHALLALGLILVSINSYELQAIYSMVLVGPCNSIMFPTIFTLAIANVNRGLAQKASGLLATGILGGALVPLITGKMADVYGLRMAFLIPALCYAYIAAFGARLHKTVEPGEHLHKLPH